MPHLTYILPGIGRKPGERYIGTWKMEPLMIAVIHQLTVEHGGWDTRFFDDRIEVPDVELPTDLVCITVETYTAKRAYELADRYRTKGIPVLLGGYHVTLCPDEALEHADAIMVGNAEGAWSEMLDDAVNDKLQTVYYGGTDMRPAMANKSIFDGKKYLPVGLEETGRGCSHHCDFCAIAGYYDCHYHPRPIEDVVAELKASPRKFHFLVDDNMVANRRYVKDLMRAIKPLKKKWAGQGTLSMARDEELLALMKDAGCEIILIGFESLEDENLRQMKKEVNLLPDERDELVDRIHRAGIGIYATFVFGYDHDNAETVQRTLDFATKHRFYTVAFNHLLPWPGTDLYRRLEQEGRLLHDKWWLADDYTYGELAFEPKQISAAELSQLCLEARAAFSKPSMVWKRGTASLGRTSPLLWFLFWAMNLRIGSEVDQKFAIPLGKHLDEPGK